MKLRCILKKVFDKIFSEDDVAEYNYDMSHLIEVTSVNGVIVDKHDDERLNGIIYYNKHLSGTEYIIALCAGEVYLFGNDRSWDFPSASAAYDFAVNKLLHKFLTDDGIG